MQQTGTGLHDVPAATATATTVTQKALSLVTTLADSTMTAKTVTQTGVRFVTLVISANQTLAQNLARGTSSARMSAFFTEVNGGSDI